MGYAKDLESTSLAAAVYDSGRQQLWVKFNSGRCYRYDGVPSDVAFGLASANSAGSYLNVNIARSFPFRERVLEDFESAFVRGGEDRRSGFILSFPGMEQASFLRMRQAA